MQVRDVFELLNRALQNRLVKPGENHVTCGNPFVVVKSSGIEGKQVCEYPGLVFGNPEKPVKKVAVMLTLTETHIEHCGALGVDLIVVHHPVADAASSGGIPLTRYLKFYDLSLIEAHEALHGLHPGRALFYGLTPVSYHKSYKPIPSIHGAVCYVARLDPTNTLGGFVESLGTQTGLALHKEMAEAGRIASGLPLTELADIVPAMVVGDKSNQVENVIEFFPQSGFSPTHLEYAVKEFNIDTAFQPTAPMPATHPMIQKAREIGINYVVGAHHGMETYENCLPLAQLIKDGIPGIEVILLQQKVFSTPVEKAGNEEVLLYGKNLVEKHLKPASP